MIDRREPGDTQLILERYLVHSRRLLNVITGFMQHGDKLNLELLWLSPYLPHEYRPQFLAILENYKEMLIDLRETIALMTGDVTDISNMWVSDLEYYQNLMGEFQIKLDELTGTHD